MIGSVDTLGTARALALGNMIGNETRDFFNLSGTSFADVMNNAVDEMETAGKVDYASRIDAKSASFEEYKTWVRECIDGMERSESRKNDSITVELSDEAISRMQADSQYANWILNEIRKDFAVNTVIKDEMHAYAASRLNSTMDKFLSERWFAPLEDAWAHEMFQVKARNSFWIGMNAGGQKANLVAEARAKQAEIAEQMMLRQRVARSLTMAQ